MIAQQLICMDKTLEEYSSVEELTLAALDYQIKDTTDPFSSPDSIYSRWPTGGTTGPSKGVEMKKPT